MSWLDCRKAAGCVVGLTLLLAALPLPGRCEVPGQVRFRHLTNRDGLSQSSVNSLFQDRRGFMWIGTMDGLSRFDGHTFTVFRHDPRDPRSLSDSGATSLCQDGSGAIWVATREGLDRFDDSSQSFARFGEALDRPPGDASIGQMVCDQGSGVWLGFGHQIVRFDPTAPGGPVAYQAPWTLRALAQGQGGSMWIGTDSGLARIAAGSVELVTVGEGAEPRHGVNSLVEDRARNALWLGTGDGLWSFDLSTGRFNRYRGEGGEGPIAVCLADRRGRLWLSVWEQELRVASPEDGGALRLRHRPEDPWSLSVDYVTYVFEDSFAQVWVGTDGGGINIFDSATEGFTTYSNGASDPTSLGANMVLSIHQDQSGGVWVGTWNGGLFRLTDEKRGAFAHYSAASTSLAGDRVNALLSDRSGALWIGSGGGLQRWSPETESFASTPISGAVYSLCEDRSGQLWVGLTSPDSLMRLQPGSGAVELYRHADPFSPDGGLVWALLEDRSGVLWIGTSGHGLSRLDRESGSYDHLCPDDEPSGYGVRALHEDRHGWLWIASRNGGLYRMDPSRTAFSRYSQGGDFAAETVYSILEDTAGHLWLATNRGLIDLDPETGRRKRFDWADGLQDDEFNQGAFHRSHSGELFFGGIRGVTRFFPEQIGTDAMPFPVVLSSVEVGGRPAQIEGPVHDLRSLELEHWQSSFALEFVALSYRRSDKTRYSVQLDGLDADWSPPSSRRHASYAKVPPGEYVFRVKARGAEGVWNEQGIALAIRVRPPFWRTAPFYALELLLCVGALAGAFVLQRRRVENQRRFAELEHARRVQLSMLPADDLMTGRWRAAGRMRTATEVGGDYFDYLESGSGQVCLVLGDATGHGVSAALVVGMVKSALVTAVAADRPLTAPELARQLNTALRGSLAERSMGMAMGIVLLTKDLPTAQVCSLGVPRPILFHAAQERVETLQMGGAPLGYLRRLQARAVTVELAAGDYLVLVSDGLLERRDPAGRQWGAESIERAVADLCREQGDCGQVAEGLIAACDRFAAPQPAADDMTVLVLRALPPSGALFDGDLSFDRGAGSSGDVGGGSDGVGPCRAVGVG